MATSKTISIKIDNAGGYEVRDHNVEKLTPKVARQIINRHAGQVYGTVTMREQDNESGECWYTTYRVTPKSVRKTYDGFGG